MAVRGVSALAVGAAGAGALVLWSGLKGASVASGLRSLLTGHPPSGANVHPVTGYSYNLGELGGSAFASDSAIANQGLSYVGQGHVYRWAGGSPAGWDCSGFCNYVAGHDLGLAIPGHPDGVYSGHGPTTMQWALFGQGIPGGQEQPGDLVVWPLQHMGIVTGPGEMVNCPGPNGTPAPIVSRYAGNPVGGPMVFRRIAPAGGPGSQVGIGVNRKPGTGGGF